ncbi:MAG: Crp/Fnr family transcriptional regulator [Chitinophagales bacterium]|nr:Crp/Fnr family transcriptional regulator [Chitinophagales bacterium]
MYELIKTNISKHIAVTNAEWDYFFSLTEEKIIPKKEFIIKEGEVCNLHGFILDGFLRTYFVDDKGNEVNLTFHFEDWWFGDIGSFVRREPSKLNTQAMEDTRTLILYREGLEDLFERLPKFERFFRILNQRTFATLLERYIDDQTKSAAQRYKQLIARRPEILSKVPQHHIASYLGITKEFLSKIRSQKNI